jgi:SAM-dependent methyltransferase
MTHQPHSQSIPLFFDTIAGTRDYWRQKNAYYYDQLTGLHRHFIPKGKRILEVGCGTGDLLAALSPSYGVGIDASHEMIKLATKKYPKQLFRVMDAEHIDVHETFDWIILSNLIGYVDDIWQVLQELQKVSGPQTRILITNYNYFWQPVFTLAEHLHQKMPDRIQNWLPQGFIDHFLGLTGFETVESGKYLHIPINLGFIGENLNRMFSVLPFFWRSGLIEYSVVRPTFLFEKSLPGASVSVIVPTHEEAGNVEAIVDRMPKIGSKTELIFVDLPGKDGTAAKIHALKKTYNGPIDIGLVVQKEKTGKVGALRLGIQKASGDIILIYDADLTVPPDDLIKFYDTLIKGKAEVVNGTRLVYPTEKGAMRFLNHIANTLFAWGFTWALKQHFTDTLCGTKGFWKTDFLAFEQSATKSVLRDRYGDFLVLLGAYRLGKKIAEVPVRYKTRRYGDTKLNRFTNGWQFLRIFLEFVYFEKLLKTASSQIQA